MLDGKGMAERGTLSTSRLVLGIGFFVLVGTPLVGFLWYTLNEFLEGEFHLWLILTAVPTAILLYVFLRFMARRVSAWEGERRDAAREEA